MIFRNQYVEHVADHFFLCQCRAGRDKTHQFHEFPNFLCDENRYVPGTGWPSVEKTWFQGEGSVQNPPGSHEP